MSKRVYREDAEQKALIQWADITPMPDPPFLGAKIGNYLFAVPNGGARGRIEAARMTGLGVRPGVADLFLSFPNNGLHGFYIEMKAPKPHSSPVSQNQATFLKKMMDVGYGGMICRGWDEARNEILRYLE